MRLNKGEKQKKLKAKLYLVTTNSPTRSAAVHLKLTKKHQVVVEQVLPDFCG